MVLERCSTEAASVIVAMQRWLDTLADSGLDAQGDTGVCISICVRR
jgi:hypothetical protein